MSCEATEEEKLILTKPPGFVVNPDLNMLDFWEEVELSHTKARYSIIGEAGPDDNECETTKEVKKIVQEQEASTRLTFGQVHGAVDMRNKRVTNYNAKVFLSKPLDALTESVMALGTEKLCSAFSEFRKQHCTPKDAQVSNLLKAEQNGLKSLRKKITEGQVIVIETGRFALKGTWR